MSKVMVTGTFDVLHDGHRDMFKQAKAFADSLIVVVARDATVEVVKGKKPLHNEKKRLKDVQAEPLVDKAVLGDLDDKYKAIELEKPDLICLGYDQLAFTDLLEEELLRRDLDIVVRRLKPYMPEKYKSSKIKENLKKE
ncbi:adenylyltransferase/cytidyltransferase family protein [Nanoarchaeota archaeon]